MRRYVSRFLVGVCLSLVLGVAAVVLTSGQLSERTESVFVYGTLLNPLVRTYACGCLVSTEPQQLTGYSKQGLNIISDADASVQGAVFSVTPRELQRLDAYEDIPNKYQRTRILIDDIEHWVYVLTE